MSTLIRNCRIVSPGEDIPAGNILIRGDRIAGFRAGDEADTVIDGTDLIAVPGFIDIHTHGRSGFDFCDGSAEAFAAIGKDKLQDGVTGFLTTSLSVSMEDLRNLCHQAENYKKNVAGGAAMLGIHLEGPCFVPECAGAQNPAFLRNPDIAFVDELHSISPVRKVSFSPELPGGVAFTKALAERGIMPSGGHTAATYERYEECRAAGMKHLTHFCNVMTPLHHLRFGMVGGGLLDDDVYVEMICDGIHLCDQMIRLIARIKSPDRMMLVTDSMRAAGMPDGNYSLGGLPVIVKDGCARLSDGSGRVAGSTLRYCEGFRRFVHLTGLPLSEAVKATSWNQASSLKIPDRGKLIPGFIADITLLDRNLDPQKVFCSGKLRWSAQEKIRLPSMK